MGAEKGELRLPFVFGDGMVLQRDRQVPVWGWAAHRDSVAVAFGGQRKETIAGPDGRWLVTLDPMPACSSPCAMTVTVKGRDGRKADRLLKDILVGEVWLCSGQSNMQWAMASTEECAKDAAAANDEQIRYFAPPLKQAHDILPDTDPCEWKSAVAAAARDVTAVGYYFARELRRELKIPVGLLQVAWGGSMIQPWTPPEGYAAVPSLAGKDRVSDAARRSPPTWDAQATMYNALVAPLVPYGIRGFLWYQGESNVGDGLFYADRMRALIRGWRAVWKDGSLPFYFVQICPYPYNGQDLQYLWIAQARVAEQEPYTGMAITTDLGDVKDIHPRYKRGVGERLARLSMKGTYGRREMLPSGPIYKAHAIEGRRIRVSFANAAGGLINTAGPAPSTFEIAGPDNEYFPAAAAIDGETVLVESPQVPEPRQVRFGWVMEPCTTMVNRANIPLQPFCSDQEGCDASFALLKLFRLEDAAVEENSCAMRTRGIASNPLADEVAIHYEWRTASTAWKMEPASGEARLVSGQTMEFCLAGSFEAGRPRPMPVLMLRICTRRTRETVAGFQLVAWFRRHAQAVRDGVPPVNSSFCDPVTGLPTATDTSFTVRHDAQGLKIAVSAVEPDMPGLVAKVAKRDGNVWTDDSIELFIQPGPDAGGRYYQFIANTLGGQYDGAGGPGLPAFGDASWDGDWRVTATKGDGGFMLEFEIPFATLGVPPPRLGECWRMNVCRSRQSRRTGAAAELSTWSQTGGAFHAPARFGTLLFCSSSDEKERR